MAKVYKSPLLQANAITPNSKFDKQRVLNFLEHYGDQVTDDAYLEFAKTKGFKPQKYDENGRGYYDEYIKNDDFLKHVNEEMAKYGEWDDYEFAGIDDDYERSFGPVTNSDQYSQYLNWKKEGN